MVANQFAGPRLGIGRILGALAPGLPNLSNLPDVGNPCEILGGSREREACAVMSPMKWFLDKLLYVLLVAPPLALVFWWMEWREAPSAAAILALVAWEVVVILVMRATGIGLLGGENDHGRT